VILDIEVTAVESGQNTARASTDERGEVATNMTTAFRTPSVDGP
jgi:hypothetical protein